MGRLLPAGVAPFIFEESRRRMSSKPKPISFHRQAVAAIENTFTDAWPPRPVDPQKPIKAVTRRPIKDPLPDVPGEWRRIGPLWKFRPASGVPLSIRCPWGAPGDRLWIREPWSTSNEHHSVPPRDLPSVAPIYFGKDLALGGRVRPSFHLPFQRRRFDAVIKSVLIERLKDFASSDLQLEGIVPLAESVPDAWEELWMSAWDSAYGKRFPSGSNPWVYRLALMFQCVKP